MLRLRVGHQKHFGHKVIPRVFNAGSRRPKVFESGVELFVSKCKKEPLTATAFMTISHSVSGTFF